MGDCCLVAPKIADRFLEGPGGRGGHIAPEEGSLLASQEEMQKA